MIARNTVCVPRASLILTLTIDFTKTQQHNIVYPVICQNDKHFSHYQKSTNSFDWMSTSGNNFAQILRHRIDRCSHGRHRQSVPAFFQSSDYRFATAIVLMPETCFQQSIKTHVRRHDFRARRRVGFESTKSKKLTLANSWTLRATCPGALSHRRMTSLF